MKDISYDILDLMEEYGADAAGINRILESQTAPEVLMALSPIRENLVEWIAIGEKREGFADWFRLRGGYGCTGKEGGGCSGYRSPGGKPGGLQKTPIKT